MNKKLKMISIFMTVFVSASVFAGCGKGKDSADSKSGKSASVESMAPVDGKKYTISWTRYQAAATDKDAEMIKAIEDKFNVKLDVWNLDDSKYEEMLNVRVASGDIPDLFRVHKPETLNNYVDQGVLAELPAGILEKYAPNILKVTNDNAPGFMDFGKVEGKQYAIPSVSGTNIFRKPLVYRKDWMDNLGITKTPETLDEFEALMYKFAKEDPDKNGKQDTYGLSQTGLLAVFGAYGDIVELGKSSSSSDMAFAEKNGKLVCMATQPEVKEALTKLNKWYNDKVVDPEFITGENNGGYWALSHSFIKNRIGFSTNGNYYHWAATGAYKTPGTEGGLVDCLPGAIMQEIEKVNPTVKIAFGQPLKGPNGQGGIKQYNRLQNFYGIGKNAEKEPGKMAKVLQILDYVSANPDITVRKTNLQGVEGKHWKMVDKDHEEIRVLPPFDKQENYQFKIGAQLGMEVPFKPVSFREEWAYKNGFDKGGIESKIQIGVPSYLKNKGELQKIREEAIISIITGTKPISYFDEYVKKYNAAGGTEMEKEATDWYQKTTKK